MALIALAVPIVVIVFTLMMERLETALLRGVLGRTPPGRLEGGRRPPSPPRSSQSPRHSTPRRRLRLPRGGW